MIILDIKAKKKLFKIWIFFKVNIKNTVIKITVKTWKEWFKNEEEDIFSFKYSYFAIFVCPFLLPLGLGTYWTYCFKCFNFKSYFEFC